MADEGLSRAQFFQTAVKKSLGLAVNLAENIPALNRLVNLGGTWQVVWSGKLTPGETKFVFYQGKSLYLIRAEEKVRAFSGLCPNDANLLSPTRNGEFICTRCGQVFHPLNPDQQNRLLEFPTQTDGEKVLVAL